MGLRFASTSRVVTVDARSGKTICFSTSFKSAAKSSNVSLLRSA